MSLRLIGVVYVRQVGSLWIIFYSIVRLLVPYEMLFSAVLGYIGLCLTIGKPFRLLERVVCQSSECSSVEDGSVLPFMVCIEGKK